MVNFWKRPFRYIVLTLLLLLPLVVHAQEVIPLAPPEVTGQAVYIPFPVNITLDGEMDDWVGVPQTIVSRGTMTSGIFGENHAFTVAVAADDANLYVMMTSYDKNIVTGQHGGDYWNEDSLEFYFNLSGNLNAQTYGEGIFQVNINPGNIGETDPAALVFTGVNSAPGSVQGVAFETAAGWGFEASIPLSFEPEHGLAIGFQAQANGATQTDRDVKLIWSLADTADQSWQNPSLFGRGIFFEIGRTDIPLGEGEPIVEVPPTSTPVEEEPVTDRPIVAVNQVGYFVDAQKVAVLGTDAELESPPAWQLRAADSGSVVSNGTAESGFLDTNSGNFVYQIDFSDFNTPGRYLLRVNGVDSQPFQIGSDLYMDLKRDALLYFYRNRSGIELAPEYAGEQWARPAGHVSDNAVTCFAGQDTSGNTWEGCDYVLDVSGGWYDAGDYGKYVVNGGISAWTLMNVYERAKQVFPDGDLTIPESGNDWPDILDEARWQMDFMLRMQVPEGQPLAGMVHHKIHDRRWAGLPVLPPTEFNNDDPNNGRFLMPPSTTATLNLAATAAQCARIWQDFDPLFAGRCLQAAETAWQAALDHPGMIYGSIPGEGGGDYGDSNVSDEFYWAAAELYITTAKDEYRDFVTESPYFDNFGSTQPIWWGGTAALGSISLALLPNGLSEADLARIREQIIATADGLLAVSQAEGYRAPLKTNDYVWGSNSGVLNNALVLALAHQFSGEAKYLDGVVASMDYILGANAVNQSFVSGYGTVSMQHPHHRFWANGQGFPPPPPGAIAGGPNGSPADETAIRLIGDMPTSRRYIDDVGSYSTNEVAINWNAPLVWVAAYLDEQFNGG
jgi:endoglucanase